MNHENIVAAIDIGTSKIVAILARLNKDDVVEVIAASEVASKGVKKGTIVNIDLVQYAINQVLDELEAEGNYRIHSIITSISGISIIGHNADGQVDIRGNVINSQDERNVIVIARDMSLADGRKLLHIIPQDFIVDSQPGIENPIGLIGDSLEARVHVVSVANTSFRNLKHAFGQRDIDIERVISSNISSAEFVTYKDEKELGVCVLDIGAGTIEITVYNNASIKHTEVISLGGELITKDIAFFMRATFENAEKVKKEIDINKKYQDTDKVEIEGIGVNNNSFFLKKDVADVIRYRCEELVELIMQKLNRSGFEDSFPAGFILCGGTSELSGLAEFLAEKSELPVRIATIELKNANNMKLKLNNPKYSNIMGLVKIINTQDYYVAMNSNSKDSIIARYISNSKLLIKKIAGKF